MKKIKVYRQHVMNALCIAFVPIVFIIFPSLFSYAYNESSLVNGVQSFIFYCALLLAIVTGFSISTRDWIRTLVICIASLYYICIYTFIIHIFYTGHSFDIFFFLDSYSDVLRTGVGIFGLHIALIVCGFISFCIAVWIGLSRYVSWFYTKIPYTKQLCVFSILIAVVCSSDGYITSVAKSTIHSMQVRAILPHNAIDFDVSAVQNSKNENVIVLQLESINAIVEEGYLEGYSGSYLSNLKNFAKTGAYFPFFWSNSVQTNRAQMNIVCGTVGNMKPAFSYRLSDIDIYCLPSLLSQLGFKTFAYRSDTLAFANTGKFFKALGFQNVVGPEIMKEGDREYEWGYDDCQFYDRSIEDLYRKAGDDTFFGYIEVSSHHFPFKENKHYPHIKPFSTPKNFTEKYLQSLQYQDYCLERFIQNIQKEDEGNTHIFITADTSWPLGTHGNHFIEHNAYNDNFLTVMAYIPPRRSSQNYRKDIQIDSIHAASDIAPTVLELLTDEPYPNSFASLLRGKTDDMSDAYEDCHVLTQPYAEPKIAIVRGKNKYIYSITDRTVTYFDIQNDILEQHPKSIEKDVHPHTFFENYYCERFTRTVGKIEPGPPLHIPGRYAVSLGLLFVITFIIMIGYIESGIRKPLLLTYAIPSRWIGMMQSRLVLLMLQIMSLVLIIGICVHAVLTPTSTFIASFVWQYFMIAWFFLTVLCGDTWLHLHPGMLLVQFLKKEPFIRIEKYALWPTSALFFCYVWIGTIFAHSHDSFSLVLVIVLYLLLTFAGAVLCGPEKWLRHADPFTAASTLFSGGSIVRFLQRDTYIAQVPFAGLMNVKSHRVDEIALISLFIASPLFASIHNTETWLVQVHLWMASGVPYKVIQTCSLAILWASLASLWMLACRPLRQMVVAPMLFVAIGILSAHFIANSIGLSYVVQIGVVLLAHAFAQYSLFSNIADMRSAVVRSLICTIFLFLASSVSMHFVLL